MWKKAWHKANEEFIAETMQKMERISRMMVKRDVHMVAVQAGKRRIHPEGCGQMAPENLGDMALMEHLITLEVFTVSLDNW